MTTELRSLHKKYTYSAFGLTINASFTIPELPISNRQSSCPDITISYGEIPVIPPQAIAVKQHAWTLRNQLWLHFSNVGRFWVNQGKEIVLGNTNYSNNSEIRCYLLGAALACALVQRNFLPLHGCGIVSKGKAILLLGNSGSGKSTLAARFQQLGYPILSDDICAVYTTNGESPRLQLAYPQMKLDQSSLDFLGIPHDPRQLLNKSRRKDFFPLCQADLANSYPIERIYFLTQSTRPLIKNISKMECLHRLTANTHRKAIVQSMCGRQEHFQQCAGALTNVSTYCFSRPNDFTQFHAGVTMLKQHLSQNLTPV
jgi:energy-coupling factor transporter ATP-binding protein EcfA2